MQIRKTTVGDLDAVMAIIEEARRTIAALGIDQWQDGYPSREVIEKDIAADVSYVACLEDGNVVGYEAIILSGEEAYKQLPDDAWHTPNEYVVVHRLCVLRKCCRQGIAIELMRFASKHALKHHIYNFRIDTHKGNVRMMSMLKKLGFEHCGRIRYDSGEREAFDLKIDLSKQE